MGNCCVSSGTTDRENENVSDKNTTIVEEETVVKEVLSETTLFTPSSSFRTSTFKDPVKTKIREDEKKKPGFLKMASDPVLIRPGSVDPEEGSEVSEICSLSLSESVSSTVVMNGYDEEDVMMMKQRKFQRSPAKTRTRVTGNNYPTRRTDQSPRKRNNGTCNGARYGSGVRDPGERSGRRSRSPATNRSVMDSNQSSRVDGAKTRKNNQSPGRVRLDPDKNGLDQQQPQNYGYTTEELLENPLVSLECFIFL
ncbi:hypothetical protein AtNW77_Chr1g0060601 [Arabidopsis thaliana]|uniref:Uncharacterized protein n=2 Tax=Arabidopsis TaxID=3701 RepID=A0A178WKZ3_ARATH|nr:hypothetical protein ISN45_At01g051460 [Arabidopsis thaliana x Arabidopsis arenosa]OAP18205.1 hypothetical protein AXX17_AT1G54310 [Arabidopsis thaliana]